MGQLEELMTGYDWHTWASGKPITRQQLATIAHDLDIEPRATIDTPPSPRHCTPGRRASRASIFDQPSVAIEPRGIELEL